MSDVRSSRSEPERTGGPGRFRDRVGLDAQPASAREWLSEFAERTPVELGNWLGFVEEVPSGRTEKRRELDQLQAPHAVTALVDCTDAALDNAISALGRHRPSAFDLLAAGAFLGYACEAALQGPRDPAPILWAVARQMARGDEG